MTQTKEIHHVYVIHDGRHSKVGITKDLRGRLSTYKTHNPTADYHFYVACESRDEAAHIERCVKNDFLKHAVGDSSSPEWFSTHPSEVRHTVLRYSLDATSAFAPNQLPTISSGEQIVTHPLAVDPFEDRSYAPPTPISDMKALTLAVEDRYGLSFLSDEDDYGFDPDVNMSAVGSDDYLVSRVIKNRSFYRTVKWQKNFRSYTEEVCTCFVTLAKFNSGRWSKFESYLEPADNLGWSIEMYSQPIRSRGKEYGAWVWRMNTSDSDVKKHYRKSIRSFVLTHIEMLEQSATMTPAMDFIAYDTSFPLHLTDIDTIITDYVEKYHNPCQDLIAGLRDAHSRITLVRSEADHALKETVNQS